MEKNNNTNDFLLIIDGSSLLSTQFFGNIPKEIQFSKTIEEKEKYFHKIMQTSHGVYTNAIYGFLRTLFSILDKQKPAYLAITWDLTRDTFRRSLYEEYKANRSETLKPLKDQFALCQDILKRMGIAQFMSMDFEADDYSGSLADKFSSETEVRIMTKDRDYLQLVGDHVKLWMIVSAQSKADEFFKKYNISKEEANVPDKAVLLDYEHVKKEYGVYPTEIPSLKGLMGDSSDNIKGVLGVGEKTAIALISAYGNVDSLYNEIHNASNEKELAAKWKTELGIRNPISYLTKESETELVGEKAARLSEELATIKRDINIPCSLSDLSVSLSYEETVKVLSELEINTLKLPSCFTGSDSAEPADAFEEGYVLIDNIGALAEYEDKIIKETENSMIGVAIEKDGDEITALALCTGNNTYSLKTEGFVVPDTLKDILIKILENAAFVSTDDYKELLKFTESKEDFFDYHLAHYLLDPLNSRHDARAVCTYFDNFPRTEDETALSAYVSLKYEDKLVTELKEKGMFELYEKIEKPLIPILASMEKAGIICDPAILKEQGVELEKKMKELEEEIYALAGEKFNILSPKQLGVILFEKLGLKGGKKTKTGYSTSADVLEKLAGEHEIIAKILEYRTVSKLKSTYIEGLAGCIKEDGRIHCTFNQTVTATGRLSCTEPNLQNIPVREELGRKIRKAFVPAEGCVFIDADYSQIELRIMAHMAGDEKLLDDYRNARDIHRATASNVFHIPYDEVTKKQRSEAKAVNFGIIYGISSFGLGQDLDISRKQAEEYIKSYFVEYPGVKNYMDRLVSDAKANEYAVTMFGRKRPIPELTSGNFIQRNFGERVAMNMPIQGTAADIMKLAMIKVYNALKDAGLKAKMLLQIHDEILIEAPKAEEEQVKEILVNEMKNAVKLSVELEVDSGVADNWFDLK